MISCFIIMQTEGNWFKKQTTVQKEFMCFLLEHLDLYIYFGQTFMELILLIKKCSRTEPLPRIKFNRFRVLSVLQHRSSAIIRSHSIRSKRKYFCNDPKIGDPGSLDNIKLCFLSNCCRYYERVLASRNTI